MALAVLLLLCVWLPVSLQCFQESDVPLLQLNPNVNAFQRKFVGDVRRCEEMEKTFRVGDYKPFNGENIVAKFSKY
ncbi:UNVERIFIED_CONTAM: hypothetical protein FKN15_013579 [Acipenser sinensis]